MIRTRMAPSPTGYMHIGAVRTGLFAWLFARQQKGTFVLRIEDTDKVREVAGSEAHILESLEWIGITPDESPAHMGEHGPYRQSERLDTYMRYAQLLLEQGKAYADTTTTEQLEQWRAEAKAAKQPFHFNEHRPESTTWESGMPIRLKIDADVSPEWVDLIRGPQKGSSEGLDDFVIIKADGYPTYNFAHIIDDHEMQITHVVRADEFISSMPKFLMLYQALGFELPQFAHCPPILEHEGNKKLSKRTGAPDLLAYRDQGYLPEAIMNFLALMGWNDGTEQEVYTRDELIEKFNFDKVQKSGARYDQKRLDWISGHHMRALDIDTLYRNSCQKWEMGNGDSEGSSFWPKSADDHTDEYKKQVLSLVQERLKHFDELPMLTSFFFEELPVNPELISTHKQLKKYEASTLKDYLAKAKSALETTEFTAESIQATLNNLLEEIQEKPVVLFSLIRISTTQPAFSPQLNETLAVLGKDTVLTRLDTQLSAL